jgi:hypothetical protein
MTILNNLEHMSRIRHNQILDIRKHDLLISFLEDPPLMVLGDSMKTRIDRDTHLNLVVIHMNVLLILQEKTTLDHQCIRHSTTIHVTMTVIESDFQNQDEYYIQFLEQISPLINLRRRRHHHPHRDESKMVFVLLTNDLLLLQEQLLQPLPRETQTVALNPSHLKEMFLKTSNEHMNLNLNQKEFLNLQEPLLVMLILIQCLLRPPLKFNKLKLQKHHQIERKVQKGKFP